METEAATENTQPEAVAQETPENQVQAETEKKAFDPSTISDEIKAYVESQKSEVAKKYSDYDRQVAQAREWEQVRNDPRFQQFQQSLSQPQAPKPFEIDDDRFTKALTDRNEFTKLVQEAAKNLLETQVGPQLQQTRYQIEFSKAIAEIERMKLKYPDFEELDSKNLIAPYVQKYFGISFEDAYRLAKSETFNDEVDKKARGLVQQKKTGSTERPSINTSARTNKVAVKDREEAMQLAGEAYRAGRPIPEFEISDSGE